jgi:hypothetical protein
MIYGPERAIGSEVSSKPRPISWEPRIMSDQSSKSPKQVVFETTADRVKQLIEQEKEIERIRRLHPNWPNQEREENRKSVLQKVQELEGLFDLIFPFITNIRKSSDFSAS